MAKKGLIEKAKRKPKFEVRRNNRCQRCGQGELRDARKSIHRFAPSAMGVRDKKSG